MTIEAPRFHAETSAAFHPYESALMADDIPAKGALVHEVVTKNGCSVGEVIYELEETPAFREVPRDSPRQLLGRAGITVDGDGFVTVETELLRDGSEHGDLQTLTWVRFGDGWKVVSGNVSPEDGIS